ncbi:16S rRNA methyltransferase [Megasphaera cerevisiae DSM 20462]|jgi:16S rRNA (cytosine1402-N4)-methyltransferase|uniref:Ribosomal RNA small subunit methyltransferase H n=1 Tax=Megasphaera cerevisiae DSM 20462 TaxID=1122219 RepID=A0A0J6WVT5_9FIRM|nr:16S rRNA (cytosine(1402)-N(4))-methyltransferase RsmH [Megasphaera cerevisiae]KMO85922.1 16S rRNA methyltransferase [Megasphaera cerevisiae DSM 20462]SKA08474.1 16S rRNA (cytosine1402-N4)-methyltransferase [Megasphaera cerevisiae DSM 20462]
MEFHHVSVLRKETIDNMITDLHGVYVDCTLGGGGHSRALADRLADDAVIIGLDQDADAVAAATAQLSQAKCRHILVQRNFSQLEQVFLELGISEADGIMFDLGVSSYQLDTPERGFSYMQDGPLDMRMDRSRGKSAYDVVNTYSQEELYRVIREYGEERWAKRISEFIVAGRCEKAIERTGDLVTIIKKAIPAGARKDGPHPAKRTFQAIRIEVNDELGILKNALECAAQHLKPGGHICVITFHSLEDRITKQTFRLLATDCICPPDLPVCVCHHHAILKAKNRAISPSDGELNENPRARSAKLRVGIRK